jgi:hypothetical protein
MIGRTSEMTNGALLEALILEKIVVIIVIIIIIIIIICYLDVYLFQSRDRDRGERFGERGDRFDRERGDRSERDLYQPRGPKQSAPKVDDEHDFPSLG